MSLQFYFILKIFQFFGMCPIPLTYNNGNVYASAPSHLSSNRNYKILLIIWSFLHIITLVLITAILLSFYFDELNILEKTTLAFISHYFIILEALFSRSSHRRIWLKFNLAEEYLRKFSVHWKLYRNKFHQN